MGLIIIGAFFTLLVVWSISVRQKLIAMDENINNAMGQIGVQLSARFDAVSALVDLVKGYAVHEAQPLLETLKAQRIVITAISTPRDVKNQEEVISEVLEKVALVAEQHPEIKADENYTKCLNAVDSYEKMVCTSCLIYNDSVNKFNRELKIFPASVLGGIFGLWQRDYLETV